MKINEKTRMILNIAASVTLCAVVGVSALFGTFFLKKHIVSIETAETEVTEAAASAVISESEGNNMQLLSTAIDASDYASYGITESNVESAYLLTATVNSDATNPLLTWSLTGGDDVSNVTLVPADDTLSCAVVCTAAFETQIIITCAASDNATVKATCTLDYVRRISSVLFYGEDSNYETLFSASSNKSATENADLDFSQSVYSFIDGFEYTVGWFYFYSTFSTGTVYEDLVDFRFDCIETVTGSTYSLSAYTADNVSITNSNSVSLVDDIYSHDGQSFTLEIYSVLYYAVEYLWDIDIFNLSTSDSTTLYNNLLDYYNNGTSIVSLAFSATGAITGTSYYFEMPCLIDPEGLEAAVTSVQLSDSSLYA